MGSKPIVVAQTVSGIATISSNSANPSLMISFGITGQRGRDYVVAKWRNTGAGTCGISLKDLLSGATYFATPIAGTSSAMTSFVKGDGEVQATISNISGSVLVDAWIDGLD